MCIMYIVGLREYSDTLLELMGTRDVEVTVSVASTARDTQNVVADKPGTDSDGGVVILGGHYDTVPDVPGANDNGSGIATLITIAREVGHVPSSGVRVRHPVDVV